MNIAHNFKYHAPKPEQIEICGFIRENAKNFALLLDNFCPDSREKSVAMTKLDEVVFWANASIARNG